MILYTKRLKLIPLTKSDLEQSLNNLKKFYKDKNILCDNKNLSDIMVRIYNIKLANIETNPENYLFYTYWLIIKKDTSEKIGKIGFKDMPDENGEIEVGYGTNDKFRSQGFMTEALNCLVKWGFNQTKYPITKIIAQTKKDNIPSQKVLKKVGFYHTSSNKNLMTWKLDNPNTININN